MGFGSKPKRPEYEQQADTPWITHNRDMNTWSYDNVANNINRVNVFDDATRQSLNDYVDDIYNRSKSDFDRTYAQTMGKTLARDYNRFGTTGSSTSLLNRDNYNLQQQRALADLAYNRAINYEDMINQELDRRYKFLNTNYGYFTNSGNTIQNFDDANWRIRNANKDIQYLNDIQDYNSKANIGRTIGGVLGMAGTAINPLLGAAISGASNAMFTPMDVSGSSLFDVYQGAGTGYIGSTMPNLGALSYLSGFNTSGSTDWAKVANNLRLSNLKAGIQNIGSNISNWYNNNLRKGINTVGGFNGYTGLGFDPITGLYSV